MALASRAPPSGRRNTGAAVPLQFFGNVQQILVVKGDLRLQVLAKFLPISRRDVQAIFRRRRHQPRRPPYTSVANLDIQDSLSIRAKPSQTQRRPPTGNFYSQVPAGDGFGVGANHAVEPLRLNEIGLHGRGPFL